MAAVYQWQAQKPNTDTMLSRRKAEFPEAHGAQPMQKCILLPSGSHFMCMSGPWHVLGTQTEEHTAWWHRDAHHSEQEVGGGPGDGGWERGS